jgi:cytochrome o ubiquinol oxidase subunit II
VFSRFAVGWDFRLAQKTIRASAVKIGLRTAAMAAAAVLLSGCNYALLDPKGPIGEAERNLILLAVGLMLLVVVPAIVMALVFAWRYRASNTKATYAPDWSHSRAIEVVVWTVPVLIILVLGVVTWVETHRLDPRQPIDPGTRPLEVQVVSLDWKWLFIYPEYGVASVNELAMPVGRPVHFSLTSSGVMNAFFIPRLGSQIYTMAGMQTQLNLRADHAGTYDGISANYSGRGFAEMGFKVRALDAAGLAAWVARAKTSPPLDLARYRRLAAPATHTVSTFGSVETGLYERILNQCIDSPCHGGHATPAAPPAGDMHDMENMPDMPEHSMPASSDHPHHKS